MLALEHKFLKLVYEEVKKLDPDEASDEHNPWKSIYFSLIYPNGEFESPFDIAMKNNSPKCIELMLTMLIEVPEYRIS